MGENREKGGREERGKGGAGKGREEKEERVRVNPIVPCTFQVVKQCCMTDGVEPHYIKEEILPHFFRHFWNQRMALDRRNFRQVSQQW